MTNLFMGKVVAFLLKTSPIESAMGQLLPGHLLAGGADPESLPLNGLSW